MLKEKPLTTGNIARHLHVTPMAVLKWIRSGKLKAYRVRGGYHRIEREDFQRFLQENGLPIPEELQTRGPNRILVIDDDPAILESFQLVLSKKGYEVSLALDGKEALEELKKRSFDLVFLDVILPEIRGTEAFKAIREHDPKTLVVLITGYPYHEQATEALEYGPAMLMRKPFGVKDIEAVLEIVFKE